MPAIKQHAPHLRWPSPSSLGIPLLTICAWSFFSLFIFNGLASQLMLVLAGYLAVLLHRFSVSAAPSSIALYIAFAASTSYSALLSGEFWPALAVNTHWLLMPLAVALIADVIRKHPEAIDLFRIACAASILYYFAKMYAESENYFFWRFVPVFGSIRHLGMSIGFLLVFLYWKTDESASASMFFRAVRVAALTLVFWSGSRASMLAWFVCVLIIAYGDRSLIKALVIDTVVAILAAASLPPPYGNLGLFGAIFERSANVASLDGLSASRITLWLSTLSYLISNDLFLWGNGGNAYIRIQTLGGAELLPPGHIHPHNFVIQALCEWGAIGLAIFLAGITTWSLRNRIGNSIRSAPVAVAGVAHIAITGMLDATLYHMEHLTYLIISLAVCTSAIPSLQPGNNSQSIRIPAAIVVTLLIVFLIPHALAIDYRIGLPWYFRTN
jgi:O-antigen ligase